jgi:hypothetical protein
MVKQPDFTLTRKGTVYVTVLGIREERYLMLTRLLENYTYPIFFQIS